MKPIFRILTLAAAVACEGCGQSAPDTYTLTGSVNGLPDSTRVVLVNKEAPDGMRILGDTIIGGEGAFVFTGRLASPKMCALSFQSYNVRREGYMTMASVTFMLENGNTTFTVTEPFDSLRNSYQPELLADIKGGEAQSRYMEYFNALAGKELASRKAGYLEASKWFESNDNPDTMKIYRTLTLEAEKAYADADMDFIKSHPAYGISAYKVWEKLADTYSRTSDELQEMADIVSVCPDTARLNSIGRRLEFSKKHALGMPAKEFRMATLAGDTVNFAEMIVPGKYNFVDFWASWCGPCRAAIPHVKELQQTYGDRLGIMSISCDTDESAWRKAMDDEKMSWPQYYLGEKLLQPAADTYLLSTIPRLLLFDDNGVLVLSTNLPDEVSAYLEKNLK